MPEQNNFIDKFIELHSKSVELDEEFTESLNLQIFKHIQENNIQLYYNPSPLSKNINLKPIELSETREEALKNNTWWINCNHMLSISKKLNDFNNSVEQLQTDLIINIYGGISHCINNISHKNIKTNNQETFAKLDEFYKDYLKNSSIILQIIVINQKIKELSNNIKYQFDDDKNKIATELYKYYYNHLDKYIEKKSNNINCDLIKFFISKHNLTISDYNIELDYLQYYWKINLNLMLDFNVELNDSTRFGNVENNFVLKFTNEDMIVSLEQTKRYTNTYCPDYSVKIKYLTDNKIKKSLNYGYRDERLIDTYYSGLIDFIFNNLDKIYCDN